MPKTQLKKLVIEKFRALNNVQVELGEHITVICGKNGTSKSSILGIAAQIFSFDKDYVKDETLSFQQITGSSFKSQYGEHFRISKKFDTPGSMIVNIELYDSYTNQDATGTLELMAREKSPRPVVRNNSTATGNTSRNFTHPVIFLSLKRLYPIAARNAYKPIENNYLEKHKQDFIKLTNELLNRNSSHATGTNGTISSAVAHGENYDHESVSAGEDNAGQIIMALMSFRKLKDEYPDYKGGLLLIDEADAGLFPTAQQNLLTILNRECKELKLQVVMTTHSPILIEHAYEQSQHKYSKLYRTVYLSNTYGNVQVMQDWSWTQISADIHTKTVPVSSNPSVRLPKINVYFEDKEAEDFFAALIERQPIKKFICTMSGITLGCDNYQQLIDKKVPEFSEKSIICLDADVASKIRKKSYKTVVLLPGNLPPDQLIFEYLYNLPSNHSFWKNDSQFTRDVFTNSVREVINAFNITENVVDVKKAVSNYSGTKKARDLFKEFYNNEKIQELFSQTNKQYNPWKHWVENNPEPVNKFRNNFGKATHDVMKNGHTVDSAKLAELEVKPRKQKNVLK